MRENDERTVSKMQPTALKRDATVLRESSEHHDPCKNSGDGFRLASVKINVCPKAKFGHSVARYRHCAVAFKTMVGGQNLKSKLLQRKNADCRAWWRRGVFLIDFS